MELITSHALHVSQIQLQCLQMENANYTGLTKPEINSITYISNDYVYWPFNKKNCIVINIE